MADSRLQTALPVDQHAPQAYAFKSRIPNLEVSPMPMTLEQLHREALTLTPEEREELAMRLLHDTDLDPEIEQAWIAECQRRIERQRTHPVPLKPASEFLDELRQKLNLP
jgi:hypothetical protein